LQTFITNLKAGSWAINTIMTAGCTGAAVTIPQTTVGDGYFAATMTAYSPSVAAPNQIPAPPYPNAAAAACSTSAPANRTFTNAKIPQQYQISSTGTAGTTGSRTIRSIVTISGAGLPVGVFVNNINANGTGNFSGVSLFTKGDIIGREKISFSGTDLAYTKKDVYCDASNNEVNVSPTTACPAAFATTQMPAAAHATGTIYAKANGKSVEFPPNPNCSFTNSLWDGSGSSATGNVPSPSCGTATVPPTSRFTLNDLNRLTGRSDLPGLTPAEYSSLKAQAQSGGIYCNYLTGTPTCTKAGATMTPTTTLSTVSPLTGSFIVYYDFPPGSAQSVTISANISPCPTLSATLVVRNGGVKFSSGNTFYGAVIAPDPPAGIVDIAGGANIIGSVIANSIRLRGTATFSQDSCSIQNSPTGTMTVIPGRWSEVDR
jgi:hypothetical protein